MLVVAGSLLRAQEGQVESDVLYRALRDFNIPKILSQDMVIFTGLLQDLFPAVDPPRKRDMDFEKVLALCTFTCHCGTGLADYMSLLCFVDGMRSCIANHLYAAISHSTSGL